MTASKFGSRLAAIHTIFVFCAFVWSLAAGYKLAVPVWFLPYSVGISQAHRNRSLGTMDFSIAQTKLIVALPPDNGIELTVNSVTPFVGAKRAPLCPVIHRELPGGLVL